MVHYPHPCHSVQCERGVHPCDPDSSMDHRRTHLPSTPVSKPAPPIFRDLLHLRLWKCVGPGWMDDTVMRLVGIGW